MKKTPLRILVALGACVVPVAALAACGSDDNSVPSNAVAVVNGHPITKADYDRWAAITARGANAAAGPVVVPDPPTYTRCIAALKAVKPPKGQPKPSDAALLAQCRQRQEQLVQQTVATLIQSQWIKDEAEKQGISVSDAEVQRQLAMVKRQSFPSVKAYERFLKQSGMTQADVLERVRVQALAQKITAKIQRDAKPVSAEQIAAYYKRNRAQFAIPERRDLEFILARTEAKADEAKAAVEGGTSWAAAAKEFSTDPASKAAGGVLRGVVAGQQDRALDKAAFAAAKGKLIGPIKGQFGWYLARVKAITPPRQSSLAEARVQIRALLAQQGQQQKMTTFQRDFQKYWRDKTNCRRGYVVPLCDNAPKPKTTTSSSRADVPPGGVQQGEAGSTQSSK